jgi:hypothetical protein
VNGFHARLLAGRVKLPTHLQLDELMLIVVLLDPQLLGRRGLNLVAVYPAPSSVLVPLRVQTPLALVTECCGLAARVRGPKPLDLHLRAPVLKLEANELIRVLLCRWCYLRDPALQLANLLAVFERNDCVSARHHNAINIIDFLLRNLPFACSFFVLGTPLITLLLTVS